MKSILLSFASFVLATSALATPAIGDYAKYGVTVSQGNQTASAVVEQIISDFDNSSDMFTVITRINFNGQAQDSVEQRTSEGFVSDAMAADMVANCASYQGTSEQVTVPAGSFKSCKLSVADGNGVTGFVWIVSGVAFGFAKGVQVENGKTTTTELLVYTNGK